MNQYVLSVVFESPGGERRRAIGGGRSLSDAIEFARESVPSDRRWRVVHFNNLYG